MSNSKDNYDDEDNVPLSAIYGSVVRPRLDNQQMNALQQSVRKQKLEREFFCKVRFEKQIRGKMMMKV